MSERPPHAAPAEVPADVLADVPPQRPRRAMPRNAIRAIAWSGHFCGVLTCFLVYFAVRNGFSPVLTGLNAAVAVFMFVGSAWMMHQLKR